MTKKVHFIKASFSFFVYDAFEIEALPTWLPNWRAPLFSLKAGTKEGHDDQLSFPTTDCMTGYPWLTK